LGTRGKQKSDTKILAREEATESINNRLSEEISNRHTENG